MCRIIEEMRNEERTETLLDTIKNLMANMGLPAEQVMTAMGIPGDEHRKYMDMLSGSQSSAAGV